jgi:hypothetical protein
MVVLELLGGEREREREAGEWRREVGEWRSVAKREIRRD